MNIDKLKIGDKVQYNKKIWNIVCIDGINNQVTIRNENDKEVINLCDVVLAMSNKVRERKYKVSFLKPEYFYYEKTIYCTLPYYLNFDGINLNGIKFNRNFNNKVLSNFFNTVSTYTSSMSEFKYDTIFLYSEFNKFPYFIEASPHSVYHDLKNDKYYRMYAGEYRELYINDYDEKPRFFYEKRIETKEIINYNEFDGISKCNDVDKYNIKVGKKIAYIRAKYGIYQKCEDIIKIIEENLINASDDIRYFHNFINEEKNNLIKHVKNI